MALSQSIIDKIHSEWTAKQNLNDDGSGNVTGWTDIRNAQQVTVPAGATAPTLTETINGVSVPTFNNADSKALQISSFSNGEVQDGQTVMWRFIVAKHNTIPITAFRYLVDAGGAFNRGSVRVADDGRVATNMGGSSYSTTAGDFAFSTVQLIAIRFEDSGEAGWDGCTIYLDGTVISDPNSVDSSNDIGLISGDGITFGARGDLASGTYMTGAIAHEINVSGDLTTAEREEIEQHLDGEWDIAGIVGGTTTTMVFSQGSYSLTGQTIGLVQTDVLPFNQGDYSVTGQDIGLVQVTVLQFEQGSYTITDSTVETVEIDVLDFDQGSYAITGQDINLIVKTTTTMSFESGSYSVTGQDIDLKQVEVFSFEQGDYNISGQDIGLVQVEVLDFHQGLYTITGQDFRIVINSPEILTLDSEIVTLIELDSNIITELDLDSEV